MCGKKFWHEIDSTPVTKAVIKLKTLVVEGEKVTELTDEPDLVTGDVTVAGFLKRVAGHHGLTVTQLLERLDL